MNFNWDENKNRNNQSKHKVSFETAQLVFEDSLHVSRLDRIEHGEQRWQTIGMVHDIVLLLVTHVVIESDGQEIIRIISVRKADRNERRIYEQTH